MDGTGSKGCHIKGELPWDSSPEKISAYRREHADLIQSIRRGAPINEAAQFAESTLTAILGRQAAYTGKAITWDEILDSNLDFSPARYEFGPLPVRPVPMPGKTS